MISKSQKMIAVWLFFSAFMVFCMAVIGAVTRLTESGLSMVEWRPLIGAIPPLSETEWLRVFDLYRETPEYIHKNAGMALPEFKKIFFWEWFHRVWGRMIGLVYTVPFFIFLIARKFKKGQFLPLFGLLILGGMQGVMGWYMVMSGLVDQPSVSHYRLAAHLGLAFLIFGFLFRMGLGVVRPDTDFILGSQHQSLVRHNWLTIFLFTLTFFWGAFVAGLDAGMIYNEFPLMGGQIVPPDMWHLPIWWQNFLDNHAGVQFTHRILAMITGGVVIALWYRTSHSRFAPIMKKLSWSLLIVVLAQIALGILTLLSQINIILAAMHQAGALILFAVLIWHGYELRKSVIM